VVQQFTGNDGYITDVNAGTLACIAAADTLYTGWVYMEKKSDGFLIFSA